MDPKEEALVIKLNSYDIEVCYGVAHRRADTDFEVLDLQDFMEYCSANEIYSVFFDCRYAEETNDALDQLKTELENKYNAHVKGCVTGPFSLQYIDETFYTPVWEKISKALEREFGETNSIQPKTDAPYSVISIRVWAFHQGIRLYTDVDCTDGDLNDAASKQQLLRRKYNDMLIDEINARRREAFKESKRIEQQKQQVILDEIAEMVHKDPSLDSMFTVKARNEYADRICVTWQVERGYEWLTKKAVRSIVELDYVRRNN